MKNLLIVLLILAIPFSGIAKKKKKSKEKAAPVSMGLKTAADSIGYAIGLDIAGNFASQGLDTISNMKSVQLAMDHFGDTSAQLMTPEAARAFLQSYFQKKQEAAAQAQFGERIKEQEAFLAENKTKEGVVTTATGLQYQILTKGDGPKPQSFDKVTVHYHGTTIDGNVFDSSVQRGEPATFPVGGVIPGWVEALQLMPVGSKWKLFIPSELAYGARGAGQAIPPYSTLIFEVELLEIAKTE